MVAGAVRTVTSADAVAELSQRRCVVSVIRLDRAPVGAGRGIVWGLLTAVCVVGVVELVGRSSGYRPSVQDGPELWHFWRQRARSGGSRAIVLLGTSRMEADVSLETLNRCFPSHQVIQLAVQGANSPLGILAELVNDDGFSGTVICEMETPFLESYRWNDLRSLRSFRPANGAAEMDVVLRDFLDDRVVFTKGAFTIRSLCHGLIDGTVDKPFEGIRMRLSRQTEWDFGGRPDSQRIRKKAVADFRSKYEANAVAPFETLVPQINVINRLTNALAARGGRIVFLRLPSYGEHWRIEEGHHPKINWDRFASMAQATCIHFRDVPPMCTFDPPDESHLDYRDAPRFTHALVSELRRRGAVPPE